MIFYKRPGDPFYYPTQAAAGKGFIQHDVPVDKAGLMETLNAMEQLILNERGGLESKPEAQVEAQPETPAPPPEPDRTGLVVRAGPGKVYDCPRCASDDEAAQIMAGINHKFSAQELISRIDSIARLDYLAEFITERKEAINAR